MSTPVSSQHVIFGAGAVGLAVLDALLRRGETVRVVNRSGHAQVLPTWRGSAATSPTRSSPPRSAPAPAYRRA